MIGSRLRIIRGITVAVAAILVAVIAPPAQAATGSFVVRFSGVRHVHLGESLTTLKHAGYTGRSTSFGCAQYYNRRTKLYVEVDRKTRRVIAIDPLGDKRYHTAAGIHIGSSVNAVRHAYRHHVIQNRMHGRFGQGADGLLVSGGHNRWLGFLVRHNRVADIKLGRHAFASAEEASC